MDKEYELTASAGDAPLVEKITWEKKLLEEQGCFSS